LSREWRFELIEGEAVEFIRKMNRKIFTLLLKLRSQFLRLTFQLVAIVVFVAVAVGASVGLVDTNTSRDALHKQVYHSSLAHADLAAQYAANYIAAIQAGVRLFAAGPTVTQNVLDGTPEQLTSRLVQLVQIQTNLDSAAILDAKGTVRASGVANPQNLGSSSADRDYFIKVMATGQPYLGLPVKSRSTGNPAAPYAVPILDAQGQVKGILVAGISLSKLSDSLVKIPFAPDARISLLDTRNSGLILANSDLTRILTPVTGKNQAALLALTGARGIMETPSSSGEADVVAYSPVPGLPWTILVLQPSQTAFAVIGDLNRQSALIVILAILLVAIAGVFWMLQITGPLQRLRTAAQGLAAGDQTLRAKFKQHNEIGELGRSFDQMADVLVEKENQLRVYSAELEQRVVERTIALRQSEEKYRSLFENAQVAMYRSTLDGLTILDANQRLAELTEYSVEELRSGGAATFWATSLERQHIVRCLNESGTLNDYEIEIVTKSGGVKKALFSTKLYLQEGYLEGSLVDITERKRIEEELQINYSILGGIIDSNPMPIFSVDRSYRYTSFNVAHAAVMKAIYGADIAIGHSIYEYQTVEEDRKKSQANLDRALTGERLVDEAFSGDDPQIQVYFEVVHNPIRNAAGEVIGVAIFAYDLSERWRAEEKIRALSLFPSENPNPVLRLDHTGTILYANEASRALLDEWDCKQGQHVPAAWQELVAQALETGTANTVEAPSGDRMLSIFISPVQQASYVNLYGRDVTESRRVEEALRKSEESFRAIFERSTLGKSLTAPDGKLLKVNQAFADFLGYTIQEMQHLDFTQVTYPEDVAESREVIRSLLASEREKIRFEKRYIHRTGKILWADVSTTLLRDINGAPLYLITSIADITEHKLAEEQIRVSEERYRSLFENMVEGYAYCQMIFEDGRAQDWIYLVVNDAFENLTGLKNVAGKKVSQVIPSIREADPGLFDIYARVAETGKPEKFETFVTSLQMWFSISVYSPEKDYFVAVFDVITERKIAENEINRLNLELEQRVRRRTAQLETANNELEAFAYSVSHDLRAPLRGIDGWSLALLEDYYEQLDPQARHYLDTVRSEAQRMGQLIDDMLQLSRVTRTDMHSVPVDLSAMAQTIASRLRTEQPVRQVEIVIQPGLAAQGDPRLLEIVLTNLFSNAWKFTGPRQTPRIEFGQTEVEDRLAFFVRDNGVGFDMAFAQKLFGAFQRLHKLSEFPGTGIGLATVQRIIHRHGGRVWAEAQVDRGATFYFTLEEEL
jgi:PAS domain S-box-containing protein